jgi:hypothetical protein
MTWLEIYLYLCGTWLYAMIAVGNGGPLLWSVFTAFAWPVAVPFVMIRSILRGKK